jgi:hypothetical protein
MRGTASMLSNFLAKRCFRRGYLRRLSRSWEVRRTPTECHPVPDCQSDQSSCIFPAFRSLRPTRPKQGSLSRLTVRRVGGSSHAHWSLGTCVEKLYGTLISLETTSRSKVLVQVEGESALPPIQERMLRQLSVSRSAPGGT